MKKHSITQARPEAIKSIRPLQSGSSPKRLTVKRLPSPKQAPSIHNSGRKNATAEPDLGELLGAYIEGSSVHTLHRRGVRFVHTEIAVERFRFGQWRPASEFDFDDVRAVEKQVCGGVAIAMDSTLRLRKKRSAIAYDDVLRTVHDKVLVPAIEKALPLCLASDLTVRIWMSVGVGNYKGPIGREGWIVAAMRIPPAPAGMKVVA